MTLILIILAILTLNLLAIFKVQLQINRIIFIILANLTTILLYCLTIENFALLQKLIIVTIIYCAVISYLIIRDRGSLELIGEQPQIKSKIKITIIILTILFTALSFYCVRNIQNNLLVKKEILINNQITKTPIIEEKISENKFQSLQNMNRKNSALINRFSDFLLIICVIIALLSLKFSRQKE